MATLTFVSAYINLTILYRKHKQHLFIELLFKPTLFAGFIKQTTKIIVSFVALHGVLYLLLFLFTITMNFIFSKRKITAFVSHYLYLLFLLSS